MELPDNWSLFKEIVIDKIKTYCDSKIWPFQFENFTAWLNNFDDEKEEYIALQLLDSLIVRSNEMAKVSYAKLLHGEIRQFLIDRKIIHNLSISKWKRSLKNGGLHDTIRFSPVRLGEDEGESGSVIYRLLSSEIDTNKYSLAKKNDGPRVIILIDDFIGSGKQFKDDFAPEFGLKEKIINSTVIYCPLIAYKEGMDELKKEYTNLHIIPSEIIGVEDGIFFGDKNHFFKNDQVNTIGDVQIFFDNMKKKYAPTMSHWFGYELAALPLAFEWGCPNQTPAIFWMNYSKNKKNWQPLFSRRA